MSHRGKTRAGASVTAPEDIHSRDTIRVLIADDHAIVRKGIRALLATEPDIEVVGEAQDGQEAIAKAQKVQPDVILMDLIMPGMDGLDATRYLSTCLPHSRILVLTSFAGDDKIFPAIKAGALGYLLKDSGPEQLVEAIQQVHRGESSLHPSVARRVLRELADRRLPPGPCERGRSGQSRDSDQAAGPLTERQVEVLQLVAQGHSNREISDLLMISEATVRTHVSSILCKLNLCSRTQAALYALREGLVSLNDTEPTAAACVDRQSPK
jgi:NarL family two-component system response regulator LiaR